MRVSMLGMGWFPDQSGGLNRYFRGLLEALRAEGVEVDATVVGPGRDAPVGVDVVASREASLVARLTTYRRSVQRREACIVDAHFALYALPALIRGRRWPLVVHFHGPWADESRATGASGPIVAAKRLIERALYRRADALIVLSEAFARLLVMEYGVGAELITVIRPGVDLDRFTPGDAREARRQLGLPRGRVLVCVRRLVPRMGVDTLLEAWAATTPVADDLLVIVGDGPERDRLAALAERLGAPVRFAGRVDDEALPLYYRAADVSVVPSSTLEGFGLVVIEALACGTPTVVTDVGGLPETVAGWRPDLVVAPTATAIAARLGEPLPDRAECRAHAETFAWSVAAERHLELYGQVAARRPRVVYLDHTAALSGGELALLRLIPALDVDAHVILAEHGPLAEKLEAAGVSVEVLPMATSVRATRRDALGSVAALRGLLYAVRLSRRLRSLRPDLVHANSLKACLYGGLAARLAAVPVVWHVRDRIADDYLPKRSVQAIRFLARFVPNAVIANSQATLATLPGARHARVIASPIGPAAPTTRNGGRLRVGIVGRIAPWKGQLLFVEALSLAFPDGGVDGVVVGAPLFGEDEVAYLEQVRTLSEQASVDVEFTGFRDDVAAELAKLNVLVHASLIPEPFGQVVVEGMAAGLPVVAAAAGGPLELVDDGVDGLLYEPGDAAGLAGRLSTLAADKTLRERLGAAGKVKAAAFTPERVAERVQDVYTEVLSQ
jgi:glycosyltransferase involved in cell wall biosynthesis